jgi:amino acid adenylation domain-containing protein
MFCKEVIKPIVESINNYGPYNAFYINNEYITYKQFALRVGAILKYLENNDESEIGLITNDHIDTYAAIIAVWLLGKTYVPINPETPAERNQIIIDQVGIRTILNSDEIKPDHAADINSFLHYFEATDSGCSLDEQLAYIFYTSGSTGQPKGVMISKKNVASFVDAFWKLGFTINETDRCLQMFELTFDLSVMSYLIPLLKGACVYTTPKSSLKYSYIAELMEEKELTIALMVPSILNYLRPYFGEVHYPKMRYSLFCGEALSTDIVIEWSRCVPNAEIYNVYGPTENTIFCTSYAYQRAAVNESYNGIMSIGKAMHNNLAVVFNENCERAGLNEIGELCLAGAQLTPGYFKNPDLNKEMFFSTSYAGVKTRFYRTGDLCVLTDTEDINFIGRKDFQVKIQGFRVELSEVEYFARKAIKEKANLVALAIETSSGNSEIALVLESPEYDISEAREYMISKMPSYMVPTQYYFVKPLPLNNNGKIDRKMLKNIIMK